MHVATNRQALRITRVRGMAGVTREGEGQKEESRSSDQGLTDVISG